MVETSDSRIFKIVAGIIAFLILAIAIINIVYFIKAYQQSNNILVTTRAITRNEMIILVSSNALIIALALVVFLWSLISLIISPIGYVMPTVYADDYTNAAIDPDLSF